MAVYHSTDAGRILLVQRPDDPDEELPGIWGLPATTLRPGEQTAAAVRRIGAEKLGLRLSRLRPLAQGTQRRSDSLLHMTVFTARTRGPQPVLPAAGTGTLYTAWRWDQPQGLEAGAACGSLCCRLYLEAMSLAPPEAKAEETPTPSDTARSAAARGPRQRDDLDWPTQRYVLLRFHEIALKGKNRPWFIDRLVQNVRQAVHGLGVERVWKGQMMVLLSLAPRANWEEVKGRLQQVFGMVKFSLAYRVPPSLDALKALTRQVVEEQRFASFRIAARRADKTFPLTSMEINQELGRFVQELSGATVDLEHPAFTLFVDILPREAYVYQEEVPGPGGLPVGVSGPVLCLLSGGIDSPVAAWRMLKRGCTVDFVHFHAFPLVEGTSREKAQELVELLNRYQFSARLLLVPFAQAQQQIILSVPPDYRIPVYRRFMLRIAERLALESGAKALVTGESIGQVSSQTLDNLATIRQVASLPVLSPLIGMDKQEIVDQARAIDTYPISIIPDQDCCTLFVPKHPRTHTTVAELEALEANLDVAAIVAEATSRTEVRQIGSPPTEIA